MKVVFDNALMKDVGNERQMGCGHAFPGENDALRGVATWLLVIVV
jgi:hypothetical protein